MKSILSAKLLLELARLGTLWVIIKQARTNWEYDSTFERIYCITKNGLAPAGFLLEASFCRS